MISKPYPKYKLSGVEWLGDLPEHWEVLPLKYVVSLKSGEGITSEEIEDEAEYPVYGGNGFRGATKQYTHEGEFVLIGRVGALCGNINYAKGKFWASEHAVVATPVKQIATFWLGELLRTMDLNQYSISAAQPSLSIDRIKELLLPLPPLPEQQAIAAFLDRETGRIDTLIAKKQKLIELLKEKRTALISHAVTKGLDASVKMKPSGVEWLGDVPEHWVVKRTRFMLAMNPSKQEINHLGPETELIFLPMEAVGEDGLLQLETTRPISEVSTGYTFFAEGDVAFAKITPCFENGKGAIMRDLKTRYGFGTTELTVMRPKKELDAAYLFYISISSEFRQNGEGWMYGSGGQRRVPDDFVKDFHFCFPPVLEQQSIAAFLDRETAKIDSLVTKVERIIEKLKEYRTALISAAVTGKIDIREES